MSSLKSTGLEPPIQPLTAAPRAGVAGYVPESESKARQPGPVNKAPPTQEVWLRLVDAYRLNPENHIYAGEQSGTTPAYAMLAWRNGWWQEAGCEYMIPISNVIAAERITARAAIARLPAGPTTAETVAAAKTEAKAAVQAAIMDMAEIRSGEARLVQMSRKLTLGSLAAIAPLKAVIRDLSAKAASSLKNANMPPREALKIIRSIEEIARTINEQAKIAIELEHKLLGEPDIRIEHTGAAGGFGNLDEALAQIDMAHAAAKRVAADRAELFPVLDTTAEDVAAPGAAQEAEDEDPEEPEEEEEPAPPPPPRRRPAHEQPPPATPAKAARPGPRKPLGPPPRSEFGDSDPDDEDDDLDEDDEELELDDNGLGSNILDLEDDDEAPPPPRLARALGKVDTRARRQEPEPQPVRRAKVDTTSVLFAKKRV